MSQKDTVWYLSNVMTRYQSPKLGLEAAKAQLAKVPGKDLENWLAWQPGWAAWTPVKDIAALLPAADELPPPLPPMPMQSPPPVPQAVAAPVDEPKVEMKVEPAAPAPVVKVARPANAEERRKHRRYEVRFRVIIRNDGLTFRTFTKDISLGGVSLENPVPEALFGKNCQIFIASLDLRENIRFNLGPTDRKDMRFFAFTNIDPKFTEMLEKWLKSTVVAEQEKKAG